MPYKEDFGVRVVEGGRWKADVRERTARWMNRTSVKRGVILSTSMSATRGCSGRALVCSEFFC